MTDAILILKLLLLLGVANGAPIFAKRLFKDRFGAPLDCGLILSDGHPLFGPSKTFRGLIVSIGCTAVAAFLLNLGWSTGTTMAAVSMLGDLFSSFLKRRLHLKSQTQAFGIDQIPEALLPLLVVKARLNLTSIDVAFLTIVFTVLEIVLSRLLFWLGIRDRPY